jgi:hypothetical protein
MGNIFTKLKKILEAQNDSINFSTNEEKISYAHGQLSTKYCIFGDVSDLIQTPYGYISICKYNI